MLNNRQRALVLGGGGFVASSWITGLITGMAEAGIDVRDADLLIGTSSGARVALQLASGTPLEEVFAQQVGAGQHFGAAPQAGRQSGAVDMSRVQQEVARAKELGGDRAEILRRIGQLALALAGPERRAPGKTQLPMEDWPERRIQLIALNAETGVRRAFDRASGIHLVDAVMATTASFGAAPVWFEGQPYIDGGYYSSDNADLAAGFGRVLVLALKAPPWAMRLVSLEDGIAELRATGAEVESIQPDDEAMEVIAAAGSPMNPAVFEPVTRAGRAQGLRVVAQRGTAGLW
ncbi:MAG TPA: patatin-like phospholipase family protein [Anaerolineales bacterium]|nr:patatin-like phospholipase family protein [Anaerolineales bacterium]